MKYIATIVFMFFISTAHAQLQNMNNSTTSGALNNSTNLDANRPTFGNQVPNRGTTTGNVRDGVIRQDSVGVGQSSTIRNPDGTNPGAMNSNPPSTMIYPNDPVVCTDVSGRSIPQSDGSYKACVDYMNRNNPMRR